jgi:hypothetical protein
MAQVTPHWTTLSGIDRDIAIAIGDWEDVADVATEWDALTDDQRFDFFIDWPVVEERTARLLALEETLPPDDPRLAKLRELYVVMERNRPVLERLIASLAAHQ